MYAVPAIFVVAGLMLALPACEKTDEKQGETTAPAARTETSAPAATTSPADAGTPGEATTNGAPGAGASAGGADLAGKLASADAYDGATDKVISKCLMCGLRMDGSADHTKTHAGYTLHFCSPECAEHFGKNPEAQIAKVEVPS
jgi:YHS domain-containing protein